MSDKPNGEDQFRTAYKHLVEQVGEADALQILDDLHSDAHAAATFGQPLFEEDGIDEHDFDGRGVGVSGEVLVVDMDDGQMVLDGDTYEARDVIKEVGYDHYDFDGDRKVWLVDEGKVDDLHENLSSEGFLLADVRDEDREDDGPSAEDRLREIIDDVSEGDRIRVEYEQKNGEGNNDKEGVVRETRLPEEEEFQEIPVLRFQRDDDQRMYVRPDDYGKLALYTAMSHAPFVGDVEEVEVLDDV